MTSELDNQKVHEMDTVLAKVLTTKPS